MGYAILRTQKLKSPIAVRRSMKHAFREQDTPNADPARQHDNTHMGAQSVAEGMDAFNAVLPAKVRKNAVLAIEYLMTASPEIMASKSRQVQDQYFSDALDWLKERHGQDNIVYAGIHRDETTPHMYAYVVPIDPDTGRLNCRRFLGGAKALSEMQTDFAERVGKRHGLERGIEGSRAKHQRVSQFYAALERKHETARIGPKQLEPQVLEKKLFRSTMETPENVAQRISKAFQEHYAPALLEASTARQERRRALETTQTLESMSRRLKDAQEQLQGFQKAFEGLDQAGIRQLAQRAAEERAQEQIQEEKARRIVALSKLAEKAEGCVKLFASIATKAIQAKSGRLHDISWRQLERESTQEAAQQGFSPYAIAKTILEHSPGQASLSADERKKALALVEERLTPKEREEVRRQERGSGHGFSR